jgi:hypothetical protein
MVSHLGTGTEEQTPEVDVHVDVDVDVDVDCNKNNTLPNKILSSTAVDDNNDSEKMYEGGANIDIKNISKYMVNKQIIDNELIEKFDSEVYKYISFIILVKVLIPKYVFKDLLKKFRKLLFNMGISHVDIELIVQYIVNYNNTSIVSKEGKLKDNSLNKWA